MNIGIWILVAVVLFLLFKLTPFLTQKRKSKKRLARGRKKEGEAAAVLRFYGYEIIGRNLKYNYDLEIGEREQNIQMEIDYLVSKHGKRYIVEVKSGQSATKITNSSTRRQILEYSLFVENDGVMLLDMEKESLELISFPVHVQSGSTWVSILFFILFAILGIGGVVWYLMTK